MPGICAVLPPTSASPRRRPRRRSSRDDYTDPGWYRHPPGTVAYAYNGALPPPARAEQQPPDGRTLVARKPKNGRHGH